MATITGLTAERMAEIEDASVVDGEVVAGNLILTKFDGTQINAGSVLGPQGPQGPAGPAGGLIPGEIRLWPSATLPELATYGKWVWADGAVYAVATYPIAASHIASQWKTFAGASDPGAGNFRVPDLRGLVPAGMDAMPGGARANRMTRAVAITIAAKTGEETHVVTVAEMPSHNHSITDPQHGHPSADGYPFGSHVTYGSSQDSAGVDGGSDKHLGITSVVAASTGITVNNNGGGGAHETVQPTVMIPYIVKLDD